jgi:hypothetical protein
MPNKIWAGLNILDQKKYLGYVHLYYSYYYVGFVPAKAPSDQRPTTNGQQHPHHHGRRRQKWASSIILMAKNPATTRLIDWG